MKIKVKMMVQISSLCLVLLCLLYLVVPSNTNQKCEKSSGVICDEEMEEEGVIKYSAVRSEFGDQQHSQPDIPVASEVADMYVTVFALYCPWCPCHAKSVVVLNLILKYNCVHYYSYVFYYGCFQYLSL